MPPGPALCGTRQKTRRAGREDAGEGFEIEDGRYERLDSELVAQGIPKLQDHCNSVKENIHGATVHTVYHAEARGLGQRESVNHKKQKEKAVKKHQGRCTENAEENVGWGKATDKQQPEAHEHGRQYQTECKGGDHLTNDDVREFPVIGSYGVLQPCGRMPPAVKGGAQKQDPGRNKQEPSRNQESF